jgi:hypothetical protein
VNLGLAAGVIIGSSAAMVVAMLLVRRGAPLGSFFADSERAAAVFGFLGAGFAILLGFVILLTFQGYSNAKSKAEQEATAVFDQFEVAALFPEARRLPLQTDLVCYARSVIGSEWPAMENGEPSPVTELWIERMQEELPTAHIASMQEETAYQQWFEKTSLRDEGRRQRLIEAQSVLPTLLWVMLILGAVVVAGFVLLFADRLERAWVQAALMAGVTAVVVTALLAVALLASPFQNEDGSIKPTSMRYALGLIEKELVRSGRPVGALCDPAGLPVRGGA